MWLAEHRMPILAKFLLVNAITFAVLLASYELLVRHSWVGLLLNGKVPERPPVFGPEPLVVGARVRVPAAGGKPQTVPDRVGLRDSSPVT